MKKFICVAFLMGLFCLISCTTQNKTAIAPREEAATFVKEERGITDESLRCITCHEERGVTHGWVADWEGSKHARKGVGCEACHVSSLAEIAGKKSIELEYLGDGGSNCEDNRVYRNVIASTCGKCHTKEYREFMKSRHSISWERLLACGKTLSLSKDTRTAKCEQCHNIQFKCDSCHTRHTFSTFEAKTPEACRTCHTGSDHPHYEMYISSKHGTVYTASQSGILKESKSIQSLRSPLCVTCHMPQGTHDSSFGLTYGTVGSGLSYIDRDGAMIDDVELAKKRDDMLSVCNTCHSPRFAKKTLTMADDIHKNTEALVKEARDVLLELGKEGLLFPPVGEMVSIPLSGHAFVLGNLELYRGKSRMERQFFKLIHSAAITWKGAYHENPGYTNLSGWAKLQEDLSDMKTEIRRLREDAEMKRKMESKLR